MIRLNAANCYDTVVAFFSDLSNDELQLANLTASIGHDLLIKVSAQKTQL